MPHRKSTDPLYTLKVASQLSNVPKHSIRQYIDNGLIIPFKTEKGRHLFSEIDIRRLTLIKQDLEENGLNIAGVKRVMSQIPCWLLKPCPPEQYLNCDAYNSSNLPCWEAGGHGHLCDTSECRTCAVYMLVEHADDLKEIFRTNASVIAGLVTSS